jgi:ribonuclease HI
MNTIDRSTSSAGAGPPKHGLEDLAQFRARLTQLRRELTPPINPDVYQAYTDGACLANPNGPGGWAAVVAPHGGASNAWEIWGHLSSTSNNRAEVLGVLAALEWVPLGSTIVVRSDSQYTVNVLAGTYKAKANVDLWTELRRVAAEKSLTVLGAVQGDVERAAQLRAEEDSFPDERRVKQAPSLPSELTGLEPRGPWELSFVQSVAKQLRAGRSLSEKQQAVIDRIRQRGTASGGKATAA